MLRVVYEAQTSRGTQLRVQWEGYDEQSWEPQWELLGNEVTEGSAREAVAEFWVARDKPEWVETSKGGNCLPLCPGGEFQCAHCCWWAPSAAEVTRHERQCDFRPKQRGLATVSARVLRAKREKRATARMPAVKCPKRVNGEWQDAVLETVSSAMYLGSKVTGGKPTGSEVQHRVNLGNVALHKHWKFWGSKAASLNHKISAYKMYVTSVVLQGFEGWHLGSKERQILNGFDLRAQMTMTGWTHDIVAATREFSLVDYVRERRLVFLGNTLRLDSENLTFKVLEGYHEHLVSLPAAHMSLEGTIFMDAPTPRDFEALVAAAEHKESWTRLTQVLPQQQRRKSRR